MNYFDHRLPEGRFDKLEKHNLFVPYGHPGYTEMVRAKGDGKLEYYRVDNDKHGIHVNVREYLKVMGKGDR